MATARESMEEDDYIQVIAESASHQGYLFEPDYSAEELQQRDVEAAERQAAAAEEQQREPRAGHTSWCLCTNCIPMATEVESLCCHEFHRAQFLLDELQEEIEARQEEAEEPAEQPEPLCVTLHASFGPHVDRHILETYFRVPKKNWRRQPNPAGPNGRLSQT